MRAGLERGVEHGQVDLGRGIEEVRQLVQGRAPREHAGGHVVGMVEQKVCRTNDPKLWPRATTGRPGWVSAGLATTRL